MGYTVLKPPVTTMLPFMVLAHLVPPTFRIPTLIVGAVYSLIVIFWPESDHDRSDEQDHDSED